MQSSIKVLVSLIFIFLIFLGILNLLSLTIDSMLSVKLWQVSLLDVIMAVATGILAYMAWVQNSIQNKQNDIHQNEYLSILVPKISGKRWIVWEIESNTIEIPLENVGRGVAFNIVRHKRSMGIIVDDLSKPDIEKPDLAPGPILRIRVEVKFDVNKKKPDIIYPMIAYEDVFGKKHGISLMIKFVGNDRWEVINHKFEKCFD